jgi:hypothetical protein
VLISSLPKIVKILDVTRSDKTGVKRMCVITGCLSIGSLQEGSTITLRKIIGMRVQGAR